ncbi:MAG: Calvin cycle protein CP12 [Synechococcus sp.]
MTTLQERIQAATEEARKLSEDLGDTDPKTRAAWDIVEELHAEAGHQAAAPQKSALDKFCEENPEAGECLIYEE